MLAIFAQLPGRASTALSALSAAQSLNPRPSNTYDGAYRGLDVSFLPEAIPRRVPVRTCVVCVCPLCVALASACGPRRVAPRSDFLIGRALASLEE